MATRRLRALLAVLVCVCTATATPVVRVAAETDGALTSASGFEVDNTLMQRTGVALASEHNKLMADTDVFGLYRDDPSVGSPPSHMLAPAVMVHSNGRPVLFRSPFAPFSRPVAPGASPASGPVVGLIPVRRSGTAPTGVTEKEAEDRPAEKEVNSTEPEESARGGTEPTAPKKSKPPEESPVEPEERSAEPEQSSDGPQVSINVEISPGPESPSLDPEVLPAEPQGRPESLQEAVAPAEAVVGPKDKTPSTAQPLTLPDTHIFCLLPEPGRHGTAPPAHSKEGKPAADAVNPTDDGTDAEKPGSGAPRQQGATAARTAAGNREILMTPALFSDQTLGQRAPVPYQNQLRQTFRLSPQSAMEGESAVFGPLWNQFSTGSGRADRQQVMFETVPDPALLPSSESGTDQDSLLDPSTFGQRPGKAQSADSAKQDQQELLGMPTFFAPYPRQPQYSPQSTGYYPTASNTPVAYSPWSQLMGRGTADQAWPYAARSTPVSRRTAYPAPWRGSGRGPTGAIGWPWPALATESRGLPRVVPSSVYGQPGSGRRQTIAGYPLFSQWYRPTVVPLPGGGGGGGGWWTSAGQFVRPATATATSEETGADSPPLSADWPWPAVSLLGGRDSLVVTGLGRSSGAMARAAGEHGWPPVATATAGGTRSGGSFSRASSGGFDLIFEDGMFHTGPMALRKPPEEYVPPQKKTKATETEDPPEEAGPTKTEDSEGDGEDVEGSGGEE